MNVLSFLSPKQLDRTFSQQQELFAAQEKLLQVNRPAKMVRDVHQFIESLLGNLEEQVAQIYCLEITKLAYATLEWQNNKANRPRVTTLEHSESSTSHSLTVSPLYQQVPGRVSQRSSWEGATPSYGKPGATPVQGSGLEDNTSLPFMHLDSLQF